MTPEESRSPASGEVTKLERRPSPEQKLVIQHRGGPARLMAGPGTGKTDVFAWRAKDLIETSGVGAAEILVLSFSRTAASELRGRTREYRPNGDVPSPQTLHSYALAELRKARAFGVCGRNVVDDWEFKTFLRQDVTNHLGGSPGSTQKVLDALAADWRTLKAEDRPVPADQAAFEKVLRDLRPVYDFALLSELVYRFKRWATSEPGFRPNYKQILVDEYQDLNPCDQAAVELISRRSAAELLIAGDDDQSIYEWRDAAPDGIRDFSAKYSAKTFDLTECWRCGQTIIDDATVVVQRIRGRVPKPKMTSKQPQPGEVRIMRSETAGQAVGEITRLVKHLLKKKGLTTGQILVLVPRVSFANAYVRALTSAKTRAINYVRPGDILDRRSVRRLLYALQLAMEKDHAIATRAMFALTGDIGKVRIRIITTAAVERREPFHVAARRSTDTRIQAAVQAIDSLPSVDPTTHWLEALNAMSKHLATPDSDRDELVAFIRGVVPDETEEIARCLLVVREFRVDNQSTGVYPPDGPVRVMTMGQAKGLSAEAVLVADLDDEIVPGDKPEDQQRRILYVSMTRARRLLYLCYCTGRQRSATAYAGTGSSRRAGEARTLSRFLEDLNREAETIDELLR